MGCSLQSGRSSEATEVVSSVNLCQGYIPLVEIVKMLKNKTYKLHKSILRFVNSSIKKRGYPPTETEISKFFKFSPGLAHYHLKLLRERGLIKFRYGKVKRNARGIKFTHRTFLSKFSKMKIGRRQNNKNKFK